MITFLQQNVSFLHGLACFFLFVAKLCTLAGEERCWQASYVNIEIHPQKLEENAQRQCPWIRSIPRIRISQ